MVRRWVWTVVGCLGLSVLPEGRAAAGGDGSPAEAGIDPGPATEIGLRQALDRALARNWGVRVRAEDVESARAAERAALAPFDPSLGVRVDLSDYEGRQGGQSFLGGEAPDTESDAWGAQASIGGLLPTGTLLSAGLTAGYNRQYQLYPEAFGGEDLEIDSRYYRTTLSLGLTQHLLKGFGPAYNLGAARQARVATTLAESRRLAEAESVAGQVVKSWLDLALARRSTEIAALAVERARDQLAVARARIDAGDLAPIEVYKVEEVLAAREGELLQAEVTGRVAGEALRVLLAPEADEPLSRGALRPAAGEARLSLPERDLGASRQQALVGNREVTAARHELDRRRIALAVAAHERLPVLDLEASLALNGYRDAGEDAGAPDDGPFHSSDRTLAAAAVLTIPLGNRAASAAHRQRRAEVETALYQQKALEGQVLSRVETTFWNLRSLADQARVARVRVESARQSVVAEEARYKVGKTTTREVLDAQAALREAELQVERAETEALKARVDLESLRGTLLEALGVETGR